nr:zinc ABC transporter substrate-binding protein [Gammaproteobacteria bacterium]
MQKRLIGHSAHRAPLWMLLVFVVMLPSAYVQPAEPVVQACATVPELGSLLREVGADRVSVTVFAKPTEDPHFVEAKPSFVKAMNRCDLYVQMGMDLEVGWAPVLLENARNARIQPGALGYVDASEAITPLEVPTAPVTRGLGDVHARGNPHYLTDPINGLRVAGLLRDRLARLQPAARTTFENRYSQFAAKLVRALIGNELAERYAVGDVEKLAVLYERGKLESFLKSRGELEQLGGWLGKMQPHRGAKVVADHNMWPYFTERFAIEVVGYMEPKPGIPPTTKHLGALVEQMRAEGVTVVVTSAYYDPRHAQFLASNTEASVVPLANQVGARPGTGDYLRMVDYNVRALSTALAAD